MALGGVAEALEQSGSSASETGYCVLILSGPIKKALSGPPKIYKPEDPPDSATGNRFAEGLPRGGLITDGPRLAQQAPRTAFSPLQVRTLGQIAGGMTTASQSLRIRLQGPSQTALDFR